MFSMTELCGMEPNLPCGSNRPERPVTECQPYSQSMPHSMTWGHHPSTSRVGAKQGRIPKSAGLGHCSTIEGAHHRSTEQYLETGIRDEEMMWGFCCWDVRNSQRLRGLLAMAGPCDLGSTRLAQIKPSPMARTKEKRTPWATTTAWLINLLVVITDWLYLLIKKCDETSLCC